ncbi:MAG: hypothetical protein JWQ34_296 [Mucilaginibacter sp.]|uniref:hypothetical protein n=1 Tax=Mucilaginibacter sp. TaxID=1882438 RepID=UPI002605F4F9|nr:hypothetical protein [Mucilaginibacter sp.]MDB5002071.1 hypothetical protein [Mucilaginibacter sp.]
MLKASALYIVIVIALVIGLLCSSLIVVAYFYRLQYQRTFRRDRLQNNVSSGVNILIADQGNSFTNEKVLSLFGSDADSISLKKTMWGLYDVGLSKAFIQKDTLYKTFLIANSIDSTKWAALYLIDEDRPLSVSGKTMIKGNAYIAKAGIKEAYVDNKSYQGDKRLVIGKIYNSDKKLPLLNTDRLNRLEKYFSETSNIDNTILKYDTLHNSFLSETRLAHFGKKVETLENIKLTGNIILFSDTTVIIEKTAQLNNVMVFARSIVVKSGFEGTCQLFATDSIGVECDCIFNYPSGLGVMRFQPSKISLPVLLHIGENTKIGGVIFTYDKNYDGNKQPFMDIGKNANLTGQIYSQGILGLKDGIVVNGSVFTSRFLYQSTFTRYENYIINTTINSTALSPYYLNSELMPVSAKKKKVLQWLEAN